MSNKNKHQHQRSVIQNQPPPSAPEPAPQPRFELHPDQVVALVNEDPKEQKQLEPEKIINDDDLNLEQELAAQRATAEQIVQPPPEFISEIQDDPDEEEQFMKERERGRAANEPVPDFACECCEAVWKFNPTRPGCSCAIYPVCKECDKCSKHCDHPRVAA